MPSSTELAVALDVESPDLARTLVDRLSGLPVVFKVGSELFLTAGPHWVKNLADSGVRVILDLKFHDIPNTVARAAVRAADLGVERFTLHAAGGSEMIKTTRSELAAWSKKTGKTPPKIIAVSVLTSFNSATWNPVSTAIANSVSAIEHAVDRLAQAALSWGADGVVCSPHELTRLKINHPNLWSLVPGIRPDGTNTQDQARVMTPRQARDAGASCIVVGRPITQSQDPKKATEAILTELQSAS